MSWPLFKANIRINRFIWILMLLVFSMYMSIMITMFNPDQMISLQEMMKLLPEPMIKALKFDTFGSTLVAFIAGSLYGFLIYLFPVVVSIVVNHRLLASLVDKGSMAYLLSTPNSRYKISITQAIFSIASSTAFFIALTIIGIVLSQLIFPGELDILTWIALNGYAIILFLAIGSIGFFASALANENRVSFGIGIGVPALFLIIQMISNADERLSWLGIFSMFNLFSPTNLVNGDNSVWMGVLGLLAIALVLYGAGIYIFNKKNLYV